MFIQAVREAATICPASCMLTFDLLTLNEESVSRVKWPISVPILVFLGLSVLDLGPMSDRQTSDAHHCLMPPTLGVGHNNGVFIAQTSDKIFKDIRSVVFTARRYA